jgi:hypothetical protein
MNAAHHVDVGTADRVCPAKWHLQRSEMNDRFDLVAIGDLA